MTTRIEKSDLARDALYDKVNAMIDEVNTKIDNKDSLPSQTGNTGKFLTTDGTNASWGEVKQIEITQDLSTPSADTVPSTKAVSDESSRIMSIMNNKVNKSGDIMTGNLIIKNNIPYYIAQSEVFDLSQNFTDTRQDAIIVEKDKNGYDGSVIEFIHDTSDSNMLKIHASNGIGDDRKFSTMGVWCRKNGENGSFAPQCNYDNSIVTTVSHGDNWIRLGNGLQICWGYYIGGNYNFPVPFKDTNYMLSVTYQINAEGQSVSYAAKIRTKTNTYFECWINAHSNYIAIGYWY